MFEGIPLYEIRYSPEGVENSLAGIQVGNQDLADEDKLTVAKTFLKDCRFVLDGTSLVSQFAPISDLARQHFIYIQSFSYWKANASHFTRRRNLDSFLLSYTYSGNGLLEFKGKAYPLKAGDAFLIDCRELHQYHTVGSSWEHCILHFYGVPAEQLCQGIISDVGCVFQPKVGADLQSALHSILKAYTAISPYREYQVSALMTELLLSFIMTSDSYLHAQENIPEQLRDVIQYINGNYAQNPSLEYLSAQFLISKYHLCRSFKKYTGLTINEYITQLRMEQAKELLRTTTLTAYQIGAVVGIEDENYFYRLFKKQVGVSPHKYRKK